MKYLSYIADAILFSLGIYWWDFFGGFIVGILSIRYLYVFIEWYGYKWQKELRKEIHDRDN